MGRNTKIEWTDDTFNPWWGCVKVSTGCELCYAEKTAHRFGDHWGPNAEYRRLGDDYWREPLQWNRTAQKAGRRRRVFCASMGDVFDNQAPADLRERLWTLIRQTPRLDWLILTKRPQNIARVLPPDWGSGWLNVWLGCSVENQEEATRRIPHLAAVPAVVRFLSCEPLLEAIRPDLTGIAWVIAGGESGLGARMMDPSWPRDLRDQCAAAGVAFFMKQVGSQHDEWLGATEKGDDPDEWPVDLRIREYPATLLSER